MTLLCFSRGCRLQAFCNLDGVECGALADLVADNPDVHAIVAGEVLADTADIDVVRAHEVERHRVDVVCRIVAELEAFAVLDGVADFFDRECAFRFEADGFGMATECRNADAGRGAADVAVHDLLRFVEHLHLFLGVAVVGEHVNVRDEVVGELVCELLHGDWLAFDDFLVLLLEFCHACCTGAACALVRGNVNGLDLAQVVDRLEGDNHHDGRAVRVSDDALVELDVFRVHFRHDERNVRVHAEETRVVDDDCAGINSDRSEFLGNACACRREHEVNVLEGVLASQFNLELFALETVFAANAAFGGKLRCSRILRSS